MESLIDRLAARRGRFEGSGRNHENEDFVCRVGIESVAEGNGVSLTFLATSIDKSQVFHCEEGLLANDMAGATTYYPVSNNIPFVCPHSVVEIDSVLNMSLGDQEDKSIFRELISLRFEGTDDIVYTYSWGLPGEDFDIKSSVRVSRITSQ